MGIRNVLMTAISLALVFPTTAFGAPNAELLTVFAGRKDLQNAFDASTKYRAVANSSAGYLIDLEDWAHQ